MTAMTMNKFKIGDRVRLTNGTGMAANVGAEAVIIAFGTSGYIRVAWNREVNTLAGQQMDGLYSPDNFELAPLPLEAQSDEDVAKKYRDLIIQARTFRGEMEKRGFWLKRNGIMCSPSHPIEEYKFTKTETIVKEL